MQAKPTGYCSSSCEECREMTWDGNNSRGRDSSGRRVCSQQLWHRQRATWAETEQSQALAAEMPLSARVRKTRYFLFPAFQDGCGSCLLQSPLNCPTAQWLSSAFCKLCYRTVSLHKTDGKGPCNQVMQISLALLKPSEQCRLILRALTPLLSPGAEPSSLRPSCDPCSIFPFAGLTQSTLPCSSACTLDTTHCVIHISLCFPARTQQNPLIYSEHFGRQKKNIFFQVENCFIPLRPTFATQLKL